MSAADAPGGNDGENANNMPSTDDEMDDRERKLSSMSCVADADDAGDDARTITSCNTQRRKISKRQRTE